MSFKESNFQSSSNERLFRYISGIFISILKQLMASGSFWTYFGQNLAGLFIHGSRIQDIPKRSVVKTLLNILLPVKTEWSHVRVPKILFHISKIQLTPGNSNTG